MIMIMIIINYHYYCYYYYYSYIAHNTFGKVSMRFTRNIERKEIQFNIIECCTSHFLTDTSGWIKKVRLQSCKFLKIPHISTSLLIIEFSIDILYLLLIITCPLIFYPLSGPSEGGGGGGLRWVRPHPPFGSEIFSFLLACYRGWWCTKIPLPRVGVPPLISFFKTCAAIEAGGGPVNKITAYGPGAKSAPPFSKASYGPVYVALFSGKALIVPPQRKKKAKHRLAWSSKEPWPPKVSHPSLVRDALRSFCLISAKFILIFIYTELVVSFCCVTFVDNGATLLTWYVGMWQNHVLSTRCRQEACWLQH